MIIDPVLEKVDRLSRRSSTELDLKLVKAVDTHMHADAHHRLGRLRDKTHCITVMGEQTKADVGATARRRRQDHRGAALDAASTIARTTPTPTARNGTACSRRRHAATSDRGTGRAMFSPGDTLGVDHVSSSATAAFVHDTLFQPDTRHARAATFRGGSAGAGSTTAIARQSWRCRDRDTAVHRTRLPGRTAAPRSWADRPSPSRSASNIALQGQCRAARPMSRCASARDRTLPMPRLILHALQDNIARAARLPPPERHRSGILFYCAFGERSAMAVQAAQDAG